jgi:hypothetical protein
MYAPRRSLSRKENSVNAPTQDRRQFPRPDSVIKRVEDQTYAILRAMEKNSQKHSG